MFNPEANSTPAKQITFGERELQQVTAREALSEFAPGDVVGAFSGYLRRSKPSREGMTAQIFGENGNNADLISVLHLTKYQDVPLEIKVFMAKDSVGRIKQKFLCEFIGLVRRPLASNSGQTAQFFADNGPNADAVNLLNQSEYLDALVYVQLTKPEPGKVLGLEKVELPEELSLEAKQLVPAEIKEIKRQQRAAGAAMDLLRQNGFFLNEGVQQSLGTPGEYQKWLENEVCCQPGETPCELIPVEAYHLEHADKFRKYQYVPLCRTHQAQWEKKDSRVASPTAFLNAQQKRFSQRFAQYKLREVLGIPQELEPTPTAVYTWALDNGLGNLIPAAFLGFLG